MKMSAVTNFDLNGQRVRVEDGYERVISFRMFDLRRILDRILQESWVEENCFISKPQKWKDFCKATNIFRLRREVEISEESDLNINSGPVAEIGNSDIKYTCGECDEYFAQFEHLKSHITVKHGSSESFNTIIDLKLEM